MKWLVVAPLVMLGSQAAHTADYWIAAPNAADRARLLKETGHDYLSNAPLGAAFCLAVLALGLTRWLLRSRRGGRETRLTFLPFAVLPPLVFALQEHLERLFEDGSFPFDAALEPTFAIGLALQLPFGFLAYRVARALMGAVSRIGRGLSGTRPPSPVVARPPLVRPQVLNLPLPRLSPLAESRAGRAPPLLA